MTSDYVNKLNTAIDRLIDSTYNKTMDGFADEFMEIGGAPQLDLGPPHKTHVKDDSPIRPFLRDLTNRMFDHWRQLPEPQGIRDLSAKTKTARDKLCTTDALKMEDAAGSVGGGPLIPGYMADVRQDLSEWRGATTSAVKSKVVNRFPAALFLQANTLSVMKLSLDAYAIVIEQAQGDVVDMVNHAAEAVDAIDCWGGDDGKNAVFNIFTGALGLVGVFNGIKTAVQLVSAVTSGGAGVAKDVIKLDDPESNPLGAGRISGVWSNLMQAEFKLVKKFSASEGHIYDVLNSYYWELENKINITHGPDNSEYETDSAANVIRLLAPSGISPGGVKPPLSHTH
ncbi:MAG TPA: hypothetical protein VE172_09225 [Stackebrandtia sp.]|nr:hypothetical protein [Stackebrandtia sp.]